MTNHLFELAGIRKTETVISKSKKKWYEGKPVVSAVILILIILGCLGAELIMTKDPAYMDLLNYNKAPNAEFLFGTDTMGRDVFSMIWYGGRISILIGGLATVISTFIAVVVGAFSGVAPAWLDEMIMRFTEVFLSIPKSDIKFFKELAKKMGWDIDIREDFLKDYIASRPKRVNLSEEEILAELNAIRYEK
jgi:peptide/nickel transport system permease protein